MAKELIVSANVHEKKVAILEDGVVTEFYVERRNENQGVVGNIYKGRVMKVLPGMQSAFVDIGLERDAFLYVSDFAELLEDDDTIDFREVSDAVESKVARADDRQRRGDRHRRSAAAAGAEPKPATPSVERVTDDEESEPVRLEDVVEQLEEINIEKSIPPPPETEVEEPALISAAEVGVSEVTPEPLFEAVVDEPPAPGEADTAGPSARKAEAEAATPASGRRSRSRKKAEPAATARRGRRKTSADKEAAAEATPSTTKKTAAKSTGDRRKTRKRKTAKTEEPEPGESDAAEARSSFERVTDDDTVGGEGANLKEEIVPVAIAETPRSIETTAAALQSEPEWRVGSFRSRGASESSFQRIDDEFVKATPETDALEDADARVESGKRGGRAEFAVRRRGGGRRRRREEPAREKEEAGAPATPEESEAPSAEPRLDEAPRATQRPPSEGRHDRRPRRSNGGGRKGDRGVATISELLHEGQEILVQIAKEPIAKKGARITSHIALPGRYLVYMPTVNHVGVSRKIPSEIERVRLKRIVGALREREAATGGFIARTAAAGHSEQELLDDLRYLLRTWADVRRKSDRIKAPALAHRDLDLLQRILRDQVSDEFTAIRVDNEIEYARTVEFVNRIQPRLVKRVKLYTGDQPIFDKYAVQAEVDKAVRPRVWLRSGGYIVINQTEALVAIDVNTGKFVGKSDRLEDTITRTNLEAAKEIVRQVRLRDLGGIIVIDFIDMEERKNRQKVMMALQQELQSDRAPSKVLSINDFGLMAITRKRVKQSLERTLCTPCPYCQGAGMVKSAQTICFEILGQAKGIAKQLSGSNDVMLRVSIPVAEAFRTTEREVLEEIEAHLGIPVTIEADANLHQEQYDFAVI